MADAESGEDGDVEPSAVNASTVGADVASAVSNTFSNIANAVLDTFSSAINSAPTPPEKVKTVPVLEEKVVEGYVKGKPFELTVVKLYGVYAGKATGYDFLLMRAAAAKEGLNLAINDGFRDMESQRKLYAERMDPATGLERPGSPGVAAVPGFSNHQGGRALDIDVGLSKAQRAEGLVTARFLWLQANAATYGFDNEEVPSEPWHWRHKSDVIVGPEATDTDYLGSLVTTASTAEAAASRGGRTVGEIDNDIAAHSVASAWERSLQMLRSTRQSIYANLARSTVFIAGTLKALAAEYEKNGKELPQSPPTISNEQSRAVAFNFKTGKWGDGRSI